MRPEAPAPPPAPRPGRAGGADRPAAGPAAEGHAFPPDLPGGLVPGPRTDERQWEGVAARRFFTEASNANNKIEGNDWTVADRLSARCGRKHQVRVARRVSRGLKLPEEIRVPDSDEDYALPKRKKKDKKSSKKKDQKSTKKHDVSVSSRSDSSSRSRGRRKRKRSSGSASESSNAVFRGASAVDADRSRAARESARRPHLVLVDTLYQMSRVLPRSSAEASFTRAEVFRRLPPIFTPWYELKMSRLLASGNGNLRTEREARTLVEIGDALLSGMPLPALMLVLGRLKALVEAHTPGSGGWSAAQHYELAETSGTGILSPRDRALAQRDQRDAQRLARGGGLPPRDR